MTDNIDFNERSKEFEPKNSETKKQLIRRWPSPISSDALYGIAGEIVRLVTPGTEADPVAVLVQLLVAMGNMIGRSPYFSIGATKHHTNLYTVLVGDSSTGRKGTSFDVIAEILKEVDSLWWQNSRIFGLGSGEALVAALSQQQFSRESYRYGSEEKRKDKRAFITEGEYASILKVSSREGNTLSPNLRKSFDSGEMLSLTKNSRLQATDAHVSLVAHITKDELLRAYRTSPDLLNGVANRNLWVASRRSQLVPFPEPLGEDVVVDYADKLSIVLDFAETVSAMQMAPMTKVLYNEIYKDISKERPGFLGVLYARAAPIVIRLSCIYALLDRSVLILPQHIIAAKAVWDYSEASIQYIFGDSTGNKQADLILEALSLEPEGLSRTEISEKVFNRNQNKYKIDSALQLLSERGLIKNFKRASEKIDRQINMYVATKDEFYEGT